MRTLILAGALLAASWPAGAQPLPVEQMSCEALWAETIEAGMRMRSQMDPNFLNDAQKMGEKAADPSLRAKAASDQAAVTAACLTAVTLPACAAMQQRYSAGVAAQAEQNRSDHAAMKGRLEQSMAGIDLGRMQAVQARIDRLKCPQPAGPGG